jgi:hypothetical protein
MRCIFCKQDSSTSKSVEHIIPESLGGKHVLNRGMVCDKCNNYLAREVEKPFLEHSAIKLLRFEEDIASKKGKIPPVQAVLNGQHEVVLYKNINDDFAGHIYVPTEAFNSIFHSQESKLIFPAFNDTLSIPEGSVLSRFLGKVDIEVFAQRIITKSTDFLEEFIDDSEFDLLRNHVRRGTTSDWPCNIRRIYATHKSWIYPTTQEAYQVLNEYDFLITEYSECYFILALFGIEIALNIVAPTIEGYIDWLEHNNGMSPLYRDEESPGHHNH